MEEKKSLCKGSDCGCNHKSLLCWLVGLFILSIVFCIGFKLGEWKSYFHPYNQDYYGYQTNGMMRWVDPDYSGYGMMRGWRNARLYAPSQETGETSTSTTANPIQK